MNFPLTSMMHFVPVPFCFGTQPVHGEVSAAKNITHWSARYTQHVPLIVVYYDQFSTQKKTNKRNAP